MNNIDVTPQQAKTSDQPIGKSKRYELSANCDHLWRKHRTSPFAEVAGALQEELRVLQNKEKEIGALKASVSSGTPDAMVSVSDHNETTSILTSTIK